MLRFELEPDGSGSVLTLTVTFPEYGKAARDAAGWHVCLEQLGARRRRRRSCPGRHAVRSLARSSTVITSHASGRRHRRSDRPEEWERVHGEA